MRVDISDYTAIDYLQSVEFLRRKKRRPGHVDDTFDVIEGWEISGSSGLLRYQKIVELAATEAIRESPEIRELIRAYALRRILAEVKKTNSILAHIATIAGRNGPETAAAG